MGDPTGHFDALFKILLVGDSGVGKSSLLLRFTKDVFEEDLLSTVGVDFQIRAFEVDGQRVKLSVWDTAGQERFRTLTASYYRGAHAVIFMFDVTQRETLQGLEDMWMREFEMYNTINEAVKMVVGSKTDLESQRQVDRAEGLALARRHNCLYSEASSKANAGVQQCFEELVRKCLETPSLLEATKGGGVKIGGGESAAPSQGGLCC